jgi:signal transduction histidine kinase
MMFNTPGKNQVLFMLHINGHPHTILTLLNSNCPSWMNDVLNHLKNSSYQSKVVQTTDDLWQLLRLQRPDALIAALHEESLSIFKAIREEIATENQPLLVLIADQHPITTVPSVADIIVPPVPVDYLEYQLHTFLSLRTKNAKLALENESLRRELEGEKQSVGGINLLRNSIVRNVAHELRTPLLQVKAAVGLLAEDMGDSSTLIGLAQRATTRLEAGVQNITLLNELVNESFEKRAFEPVQLKEVVDSAVRNLRRSWEHKDNVERIIIQIPRRLPPVSGDKHRLVIAIQLLIDNALKFSDDKVEVSAKRIDTQIHIAVRDSGIGIPQDKIDRIFESFYQVDHSSTRPYGGMGIGLAIVRYILERHNASIKVETDVGKGSTFSFVLMMASLETPK